MVTRVNLQRPEVSDSEGSKKFWTDFTNHIIKVSDTCLIDVSTTSKSFPTKEIPITIEEGYQTRLECKTGQYRKQEREDVRAVRKDKEAPVPAICEILGTGSPDCPKIGQNVSNLSDLEINCPNPESQNRTR